jgi:hypothetical protein
MSTITIGVDLAKQVFSACEMDGAGHVLRRQDLRCEPFGHWLTQQPVGTSTRVMHASTRTRVRTSGVFGCARSSASVRSPPMRRWLRRVTPVSSSTVGKWRPGSGWCPCNIPAAGMRDRARSAVVAMRTCARC